MILVRPDFHLYGACSSDEAAELASGFLTRLGALESAAIS